jgi:predicted nucleotidyltransferase
MTIALGVNQDVLAEFCRRNQIVRLALFGSVLHDDFAPGVIVTLLDMARMEAELTRIMGYEVDLRTPDELSRYVRDQVLADAVVQYAA